MLSKNVLKRLEEVEKKLAVRTLDLEREKRLDDDYALLWDYEYLQKEEKMSLTPEEIKRSHEESTRKLIEWYDSYSALSPEEKKRQDEIQDLETAKELEQFRVWLNSEERKQFDTKYAEYEADRSRIIAQFTRKE